MSPSARTRILRPAACVAGVTLAALALREIAYLRAADGPFVDVEPGTWLYVAVIAGAALALACASRLALAVALGPLVAVALWPADSTGPGEISVADEDGATSLSFDGGTLYAGFSSAVTAIDARGESRYALTVDADGVNATLARDGRLYAAARGALLRVTPGGEERVLEASEDFYGGRLAPAPRGGVYLLSGGNDLWLWRAGRLRHVTGGLRAGNIAADGRGGVYVADTANGRVLQVGADGSQRVVLGERTARQCARNGGWADPLTTDPRRCLPVAALAAGPDGTLYLAPLGAPRILAFREGRLRVIAGTGLIGSDLGDGQATGARLGLIRALAVGPDGDLFAGEDDRVVRIGTPVPEAPPASTPRAVHPACGALARYSAATVRLAAASDAGARRQRFADLEAALVALDRAAPDELRDATGERLEELAELRSALGGSGYEEPPRGSGARGALLLVDTRAADAPLGPFGERECDFAGGIYDVTPERAQRFCATYRREGGPITGGRPAAAAAAAELSPALLPRDTTASDAGVSAVAGLGFRLCGLR